MSSNRIAKGPRLIPKSRKHCVRHNRAKSNYPERLRRRGLSSVSVRMEGLEILRKRQGYNEWSDWQW